MGDADRRVTGSCRRKKSTNTAGSSSVCLRTQIGAISPSGCRGDVSVNGERGECAFDPLAF